LYPSPQLHSLLPGFCVLQAFLANPDHMTSPAAALLQWLDEKGSDVMQALMAQHGGAGLDPAVLHTTAAAMPVCLQV
jgi:hypothetical protein